MNIDSNYRDKHATTRQGTTMMDKRIGITLRRAAATLLVGTALAVPLAAHAAGTGFALDHPRIDTANEKSLQRGARTYVNYCMGCHSLGYQRYSRVAQDLGLTEEEVSENLIFTTDEAGEPTKVGALMTNNMTKDYGTQAFGVAPPNLALTARSRGVDWLYTYFRTFYLDPDRAGVGVNNLVFPGVGMPHVLWKQQGLREPVFEDDGHGHQVFKEFRQITEGTLTTSEYDNMIADLVNFMAYSADPIKETRHRVGLFVLLFLVVLLVVAYLLKKEYWKDVVK